MKEKEKKLNNLIERFITAMEKIADALSAPAFPTKPCACEPKAAASPAEVHAKGAVGAVISAVPAITPPVYAHEMAGPVSGYKGVTDYEALKKLCAERGIEVPPRTKTTTLIKTLSTWDAVQAAKPAPAADALLDFGANPPVVKEVAPAPAADPFFEDGVNLGGAPPVEDPPPKARTFEETLIVLQALMKVRGNAYVSAMIKKHTGFEAYKDVKKLEKPAQDAALTALYNEATQELN